MTEVIMVGRVGIEPTVFTLWVRDLQSRAFANYAYLPMIAYIMFSKFSYIGGWYRICTYDAWVAATSLSLLGEPPLWSREEDLNLQHTDYRSVALPIELPRHAGHS